MKNLMKTLPFLLLLLFGSLDAQSKYANLEVSYFHATIRCQGCLTIEEYIKNTVDTYFFKEVKAGTVIFKSYDFLKAENQHFQKDYDFEGQTLIIRKIVNGKVVKWKNLDKIWDYSNDYEKFSKYVKKEIEKLLKDS